MCNYLCFLCIHVYIHTGSTKKLEHCTNCKVKLQHVNWFWFWWVIHSPPRGVSRDSRKIAAKIFFNVLWMLWKLTKIIKSVWKMPSCLLWTPCVLCFVSFVLRWLMEDYVCRVCKHCHKKQKERRLVLCLILFLPILQF